MVLSETSAYAGGGTLAARKALPYDYIVSWATMPGQGLKRAIGSLELFARKVMPVLRATRQAGEGRS